MSGLLLCLIMVGCTQKPTSKEQTKSATSLPSVPSGLYDIHFEKDFSSAPEKNIDVFINEVNYELKGKTLTRFSYTDKDGTPYLAGMPLLLSEGQKANIHVTNNTSVDTNIHWHGLSLPNDQDGPGLLIKANGGTYDYSFTPDYSGTYWYHSHNRPVRDQVDNGMYGPLIILDETAQHYTQDKLMVLDDWVVNREGGHMQIEGDTDTVNGLTGDAIEPIVVTNEDKVKLRFIQAATAQSTTLSFPFDVLVTHTDGLPLKEPIYVTELTLAPGERYDVELLIQEKKSQTYTIVNEREQGLVLPIEYQYKQEIATKPAFNEKGRSLKAIETGNKELTTPDISVEMDSKMGLGGHDWTINGDVFPDAESFDLEKGKPYVIRFQNNNHMNNHPMHIHGAHFKVLSYSGTPVKSELWKDTTDVPPGEYTDVLIQFDRVGEWMLHCHILDHEDGGMMTTINVI